MYNRRFNVLVPLTPVWFNQRPLIRGFTFEEYLFGIKSTIYRNIKLKNDVLDKAEKDKIENLARYATVVFSILFS